MTSLLIAHSAVWLLLIAMVAVLFVLTRQIGGLHQRLAPAGALAVNALLEVGQRAPRLAVVTLTGRRIEIGDDHRSRAQLLLFIAPDCPISRSLLPVLAPLVDSERWLELLLASDGGSIDEHRKFAAGKDLEGLDYALSEDLGRAFGVSKLPYAVLIDETGRIAGFGIVNSREHLESLFEAKESGLPSIQAFMAASDQFHRADGSD